jgi:hypothetical protein
VVARIRSPAKAGPPEIHCPTADCAPRLVNEGGAGERTWEVLLEPGATVEGQPVPAAERVDYRWEGRLLRDARMYTLEAGSAGHAWTWPILASWGLLLVGVFFVFFHARRRAT